VGPVVNRADVPERRVAEGDLAFARRRIGAAAGTLRIGAGHFVVEPGRRQMPVHVHGDEEEIFFVLRGSGLGYEQDETYPVTAEDVIVQRPLGRPHTFLAGDDGLELLAFASGSDNHLTFLPRARVMFAGPRWLPLDSPHPFQAEGLAGALQPPPPGPRPDHVVALAEVEPVAHPGAEVRRVGETAGSRAAGLNHVVLAPRGQGAPLHCHALEEELFYVTDGSGTLVLGADERPLGPGDIVARPPSSGVAHALRAGDRGMTYLVYGTREPGDSVYYPETGEVRLRGLGVTLDVSAQTSARDGSAQ